MSNNQLITKIAEWANKNYVQEQSFLYGPSGPKYIRLSELFSVLNLLKEE